VQAKVIAAARTLLGKPYVWGGTGPNGYDCSGLTGYAYAAAGISLPRTAAQQWLSGPHPQVKDLQPGDLLFWASDPTDMSSIHHVAIYLGDGMMISTNHTGDVARIQPVWLDEFVGATRPDPAMALRVPGPRWAPGT
jgi:cell wall-associated NlpC family hydrolase